MKHILLRTLILILILILILAAVGTVTFFAAGEKTPTIGFDSAEAEKGETVSLQLTIKNNPGIAGLLVSLKYDTTALTLTETKKGTLFSGFTAAKNFVWDGSKNVTKDGVLATFTFTVAENAAPGEYEIEFIVRESINENYEAVELSVQNGKIVVKGEPQHTETSGACGDNLTWALDLASGVLTISGSGDMYDYTNSDAAPWYSNKDSIKTVVINEGVTSIGAFAFSSCDALVDIHYKGQKSGWDKIKVGEGNEPVANANIVFASCNTHTYDNACDEDCNVCGYTRTVAHSYAESWSSDKDGHWHACSICGAKDQVVAHTAGPEATEETPQLCTVCNYEITPAKTHEHKYEGDYITDADGHYQNCSCGESGQKEAHTFDKGSVVKEPTADAAGEKHYTCSTCGYVEKVKLEPIDKEIPVITPDDDGENRDFPTVYIVIGVVAVVLIAAGIFLIIIRKNKNKKV